MSIKGCTLVTLPSKFRVRFDLSDSTINMVTYVCVKILLQKAIISHRTCKWNIS